MDFREEFRDGNKTLYDDGFIRLLYWSYWKADLSDIHPHVHPYWQIEFILEGTIHVKIGEQEVQAFPGDVILIPPMNRHTFLYQPQEPRESWSLKFDTMLLNGILPWQIIRKDNGFLAECCDASLVSLQRLKLHYETEAPLLCALLKVLLLSLYKEDFLQKENPLLKKVQLLIDDLPYSKINAPTLAKKCSYSADHLSVLIKEATGLSLKAYINRHIQKKAEALLANSGCSIGEIADRLGFVDLYTFSHFFHNNAGMSPSSYRKSLGKAYFPECFF